LVYHMISR